MKKSQHITSSWSLRNQLWGMLFISGILIIFLAILGGWWLQQFNKKKYDLQVTSQTLQHDLQQSSQQTQLLNTIQADLDLYMRSAPWGILDRIRQKATTLHRSLPKELQPQLNDFIKQLDILKIRMNSFQKNQQSIFSSEQHIIKATEDLLQAVPLAFHQQIRQINNRVTLTHHRLYRNIIFKENQTDLENNGQAYEQLFKDVEKRINNLTRELPGSVKTKVKRFQNAYYELEESLQTIIAIRAVTLRTKTEVATTLSSLQAKVTEVSLTQANVLNTLTLSGLDFLKNNMLAFSVVLVLMAVLGGLSAIFLIQTMVKPLFDLTEMLKKMTRMLSGLRNENEFEKDFTDLLLSMANHDTNEIGQVTTAVKQLLSRLRELATFRQDIEADESTGEIYQRLARIFKDRLHLTSFIIFEIPPNGTDMIPALSQITLDGLQNFATTLTNDCRVRRNKSIVNSFHDSHTCSLFSKADTFRYVCIPLITDGQVNGVVQFFFSYKDVAANEAVITESLTRARHFIAEALPVLHAKRLTLRLQIMATEDPLTGLYNRHYLETSLDRIVAGVKRRKTKICVLMCDVDYFKEINDSFGHDAGDLALQQLASLFLNNVRETDLVIRFGGEEFMILLVDSDTKTSIEMAEHIQKQVQRTIFQIPGHSIRLTISIGTAVFPEHGEGNIWDCFKFADIALYQAKENGRNQVVHYKDPAET